MKFQFNSQEEHAIAAHMQHSRIKSKASSEGCSDSFDGVWYQLR